MDLKASYLEHVYQLKKNLENVNVKMIEDFGLFGNYKVVSANLSCFLPSIAKNDHLELIRNIHFNRSLAVLDQEFLFLLENLTIIDEDDMIGRCRKRGYIFATYHTGSYRLLIALLSKLRVSFCLVTEQNFINKQGNKVNYLYKKLKNDIDTKHSDELEILNAQNPNLILKLVRKLRDNHSVVFYIDGNTGTNEFSVAKEKLLNIKFLNCYMNVRKGIGFLSHFTKTPIVSVISKRTSDFNNELLFERIGYNDLLDDRDKYVFCTTKKLFSILENFVSLYPEQWEGWFYVHKFIERNKNHELAEKNSIETADSFKDFLKRSIVFNSEDYETIKYNEDDYFLVNNKDYSISKITPDLFNIIDYFSSPQKVSDINQLQLSNITLEESDLKELFGLKILKAE